MMQRHFRSDRSAHKTIAIVLTAIGAGGFMAEARAAPSNDDCANATPVPFDNGTLTGTLVQATPDGVSTCDSPTANPDAWYRYRPTQTGRLHLNSCPTIFNNVVSAHRGCPGTTANQIVCAHGCNFGPLCGPTFVSCFVLPVAAGGDYIIRMAGYDGASGSFTLRFQLFIPDGDFNRDGVTDGADIQAFVGALLAGSANSSDLDAGDFNGDGRIDGSDVSGLVAKLLA